MALYTVTIVGHNHVPFRHIVYFSPTSCCSNSDVIQGTPIGSYKFDSTKNKTRNRYIKIRRKKNWSTISIFFLDSWSWRSIEACERLEEKNKNKNKKI